MFKHPYAAFLSKVEKPSRYVGGEYQEARKDPATVSARICLAFPDVYEIGMSHLGTKILYGVLNKTDGIACERVFSPWLDCEAELRARGLPLVTLETATPVGEFDVVGFSLQYELTYTNVLAILDLAGIPLRAAERDDRRAAGHRRRPDGHAPRAAGPVHRRLLHRRGGGGAAGAGARGGRAAARGRSAAGAALPAGREISALRPRALRDGARRGERPPGGRRAARPARAGPPAPRAGGRHQQVSLPRRLAAALRGGDLRSHGGRGGARLHRGVPLLPGGDDLPSGARARSGGGDRRPRRRRQEGRLRRDGADVAVDGRLLLRDAAGEGGDGQAGAREGVALGVVAARLRAQRRSAGRDCQRAGRGAHLRAGGRHAADARRDRQERHRGRHHRVGPPGVRAGVLPHEALLHDRPADRDRRGRPGDRRDRGARAGDWPTATSAARR